MGYLGLTEHLKNKTNRYALNGVPQKWTEYVLFIYSKKMSLLLRLNAVCDNFKLLKSLSKIVAELHSTGGSAAQFMFNQSSIFLISVIHLTLLLRTT